MSFSAKVKDEAARQRLKGRAEKLAFLSAATCAAGSLTISRNGVGIRYVTENHAFAKLIAQTAAALYQVQAELSVNSHERLNARNIVVQLWGEGCQRLLSDTGCLPDEAGGRIAALTDTESARRSFIKGAFLGCGSVSNPGKGYHLELVCKDKEFADTLCGALADFGINARLTQRKSSFVVYIKEGERVSEFLTLIGAMSGTMEFEHARIVRNLTNDLNRQRNFENANIHKTALAAAQQLIDIELIRTEAGLDSLPQRLRETAEFRLNNPEATLAEMAEVLGVGKSGINHRMARIAEIAEQLRLEKGSTV